MIGLDTSVLVRQLTQDDPSQSPRADALIEERLTAEEPGFISIVTLAETVWVLERAYKYPAREIAGVIERFLQISTIIVEREEEVFLALTEFKQGRASFTDALIGFLGASAGCSMTLTFDRKAPRLPGFALA